MPARILDVTEEQYHADPCPGPSLSQSVAHTLVTESPRHAWLQHPKLGGINRPRTKNMDKGSILHALLLGKGKAFEMVKANDWRTNAAKDARAAIEGSGKIAVLAHELEALLNTAERVSKNCASQGFPLDLELSQAEVTIEWTEAVDKDGADDVLCRCRMDMTRADNVLYDLKTCASANPRDIERHFVDNGYDIQQMAYTRAWEQLHPEAAGRTDFVFLFCETAAPFEVVPIRIDGIVRDIGLKRWKHAVRLWRQLLDEGSWPWPGYSDGAVTISAPIYIITRELPEYA